MVCLAMKLEPIIQSEVSQKEKHQYSKLLEKGFQLLIGTLSEEVGGKQCGVLFIVEFPRCV